MSSIQTPHQNMLIADRRRGGDRRREQRRQRIILVQIEQRRGQERRRGQDRRQYDLHALYAQSCAHADLLCSELATVPADNPISRLLVVQRFLLDHRPQQGATWIMKWARRLRDTYAESNRQEMYWTVFCALHRDRAHQTLGGRQSASHRSLFLQQMQQIVEACLP